MRYLPLLLALAVPAASADPNWKVYAAYSFVDPVAHERIGRVATVEWDRSSGWAAGVEYRFNAWGGIALDYERMDHNLLLNDNVLGWADETQISGDLNMYLIDTPRWGMWFGPTLAYVDWSDLEQPHRRDVHLDNEWSVGLSGGTEYRLSPWLGAFAALRYVQTEVRQGTGGIDVDPLSLRTGLAVRF